ncbi:21519_t:CDS:2, partial [Entrophospora sp. SA101]
WLGIEGRLDQLIIDKWLKSQIGMVNHNNDNKDKSVLISSNNNNKKHHHSKSNSLNDSLSNIASSVIHKFSNSNLRKYPPESLSTSSLNLEVLNFSVLRNGSTSIFSVGSRVNEIKIFAENL